MQERITKGKEEDKDSFIGLQEFVVDILRLPSSRRAAMAYISFPRYDEHRARTIHHTHCCIGTRRATHRVTSEYWSLCNLLTDSAIIAKRTFSLPAMLTKGSKQVKRVHKKAWLHVILLPFLVFFEEGFHTSKQTVVTTRTSPLSSLSYLWTSFCFFCLFFNPLWSIFRSNIN